MKHLLRSIDTLKTMVKQRDEEVDHLQKKIDKLEKEIIRLKYEADD